MQPGPAWDVPVSPRPAPHEAPPAAAPRRSAWQAWGRNVLLFVVTAASVFLTGAGNWGLIGGLKLVVGLLAILLAHEMGHYLYCRYYRVDATLPFFIPAPWLPLGPQFAWIPLSFVGTLGAVIRIRGRIPHRRALFDIGIAGPLAGFAVCLPVLFLGTLEATLIPVPPPDSPNFISLGDPMLVQWAYAWLRESPPAGMAFLMGPLATAAWFGIFVTALNLIPIGQLDGGHVTYALLRERAALVSRLGSWLCVLLVYFGPNWLFWSILLRILGRRHPPTFDDGAPVGRARAAVGVLGLLVFMVCFVPNPIVWSWRDFFETFGIGILR